MTESRSNLRVTIWGLFSEANGWGRHAASFADALAGYLPVELKDLGKPNHPDQKNKRIREWMPEFFSSRNVPIGIGIGPIDYMNAIAGKKKVACVVWETSLVPQEKLRFLRNKDQIWVPSQWCKELFVQNGIPEDTVIVVPEGVDTQLFHPLNLPQNKSGKPFRFLCIGKWEVRKGIEDLISVYSRTFSRSDPVELLLHTFNPYIAGFSISRLEKMVQQEYPRHPKITFLNPMTDAELVRAYCSADAFVLPTKAEAWGLTIIEAMACALPVLVTNFSGHTEFVNANTGYLIDVKKMIPVRDPFFFKSPIDYGVWAQPDLEHLEYLMRHVVAHRDEAKAKGKRARNELIAKWTWDHAARKGVKALGI